MSLLNLQVALDSRDLARDSRGETGGGSPSLFLPACDENPEGGPSGVRCARNTNPRIAFVKFKVSIF